MKPQITSGRGLRGTARNLASKELRHEAADHAVDANPEREAANASKELRHEAADHRLI